MDLSPLKDVPNDEEQEPGGDDGTSLDNLEPLYWCSYIPKSYQVSNVNLTYKGTSSICSSQR